MSRVTRALASRDGLAQIAVVLGAVGAYALGVGIGLVLFARSRVWRLAGALYPPLVFVTIVATGNHFILDALAGIAVLGIGFVVVVLLDRRRREREESTQEPCYT